ncbi:hypothetical protein T03_17146 [Trichinella britovi]|uniref:Uncharacterized protein n=1 Tax=Trichinella britovi TaxID=45882 RepID=A0A0V0YV07_TRIBR|nr:hypothetical protein T03_17146 [Trichinella britovi]
MRYGPSHILSNLFRFGVANQTLSLTSKWQNCLLGLSSAPICTPLVFAVVLPAIHA